MQRKVSNFLLFMKSKWNECCVEKRKEKWAIFCYSWSPSEMSVVSKRDNKHHVVQEYMELNE